MDPHTEASLLARIAEALERLSPPPAPPVDLAGPAAADAFVWEAPLQRLRPVPVVARVELGLLAGIDHVALLLLDNTRRFASGLPANNALLWGARGMGKSSLIKAVHATVNAEAADCAGTGAEPVAIPGGAEATHPAGPDVEPASGPGGRMALIEIHREDIESLPSLLQRLAGTGRRCLLFCDDLSFDEGESSYKSLKAVLEGGLEGRPANVLFYATSNRRHLMPRQMIDNERGTGIHPGEAVEEKVSLSDRFGLWLGFHPCNQEVYLEMVGRYARHHGLELPAGELRARALEWAQTRGNRSGRVAYQFTLDLAGRLGRDLEGAPQRIPDGLADRDPG